ncbi:MAG: HD-GYP domain-containing protein [Actinobacteria bacterium]|nr:MAG: HD-GYP domain-containing protein [Actinomycetota bacterium]
MSAYSVRLVERARLSFARREQRTISAERRGHLLIGGGFVVAAVALAISAGAPRGFSVPIATLYVLGIAVASNVRFDVGAGFTVPTQAVFVPMLFAVPVSLVPLLVALGLMLGMAPSVWRRHASPSRVLTVPANSWFALGPSFVLLAAHDYSPDGRWGILLLALAAQLACDFMANAAWEGLQTDITIAGLVEEVREVYAIDIALSPLGLAVAFAAAYADSQFAALLIVPLFGVLGLFSNERQMRLAQLLELTDAYHGTALLLGDVVEADDGYTGEHCRSVVRLALDVARELGLDPDQRRAVELGALLHDVGKVAIPKEIINKPGKLDEREWEIIKTHTVEGQRMLDRIGGFMGEVGQIVRSHHERWDGGGYPDGLSGEVIPVAARIVSACDTFNAMTTTRSYRKALPLSTAITELTENAGTQLDPNVVQALVSVVTSPVSSTSHKDGHQPPADQADGRCDPNEVVSAGAPLP